MTTALARSSGFVQRTSKLTGAGFVQAWVFACMDTPMPTWEDVSQRAATVGVTITAQHNGTPPAPATSEPPFTR